MKTLRDIPCQPDHALLIGLAPAEPSIRAGHYYQGKLGKRIWRRLRDAGLLQELLPGREDESLERSGHGVTDLIKRPIKTSREVMSDEAEFASVELRSKVESWRPAVVIFVFKEVTRLLVDHVHPRPGRGPRYVDSKSFLLMGPYAPLRDVDRNVKELRHLLNEVGLV